MEDIKTVGVGEIPCIGNGTAFFTYDDEQFFVLEFKVKRNKMVLVFFGVAKNGPVTLVLQL